MAEREEAIMELGSAWNRVIKDKEHGQSMPSSIIEVVNLLAQRPALLKILEERSR